MGQAKKKTMLFLAKHPKCCFCGGQIQSTTVDHIPARVCFPGRAYPDGFEFPACKACQNASRQDELIFGFYVRMMDRNAQNYDPEGTHRMISGMANNAPHLLPNPYLSNRAKRSSLKSLGLAKPSSMLAQDIPLVEFDGRVHEHLRRYLRKIACAIFYREFSAAPGANYQIWTHWDQSTLPRAFETLQPFVEMTPHVTIGARPNLDFGDRFSYRFNKSEQPDCLAAIAKFGEGMIAAMLILAPKIFEEMDNKEDWVTVENMFG
jgi:hypothetical protein